MRYAAVATPSWLLLVDLQTRQVQPLEFARTEYYGISWFPNGDDLVLSHSGLNNSDLVDVPSYAQSEKGWLSHGSLKSRLFLSAPHQIICAPDNRVVCSNTGRNVISVFDFAQPNVYQEGGISDARWDRLTLDQVTGDHLNSVYIRENKLYVIAHGHSKGSKLATFSYPDLTLISVESLGVRTGLHNIWVTSEGQRISCHSESGSLIDLDDKTPIWESASPIYTRGLAVGEDHVLIGESQRTGRDLRKSSLSGLWVLDRHNWQAIDYIALGPFGAINEVRVLDVPDDAHHGHSFAGIKKLLSKDALLEVSTTRIASAKAYAEGKLAWVGWDPIFGSSAMQSEGTRHAIPDQLCLVIRDDEKASSIAFSYELDPVEGTHVSAVFDYQGGGGDCNMIAMLLQTGTDDTVLSVWRHDGFQWSVLPDIQQVVGLPMSGEMQLISEDQHARLLVDGKEVINLDLPVLGLELTSATVGIRWMGGSVKPVLVGN